MPQRLWRVYRQRRVVNINANIILGGLAAILLTVIPIHFIEKAGIDSPNVLPAIAVVLDIIFDVAIYYALHWVANHWQRETPAPGQDRAFFKDATLIQFERAILSPLYYLIAYGLTNLLLRSGLSSESGIVIGFVGAILVTRVIHTVWGLRTGRFRDLPPPPPTPPPSQPGP